MSSIQFVLIRATQALSSVSDSARLDAEILLSTALQQERSYLRTWPEQTLSAEQLAKFNHYLAQRLQGQPIAYILGYREFWSRKFMVNPHVLIPRHETELLIEVGLKYLPRHTALKILDLGTGSGIIAITLAAERPKAEVWAADRCIQALEVARYNAQQHQVNRIKFYQSDWFNQLPPNKFDCILSNPPYIAEDDPHLQQGDLRFEPSIALMSARQGLQDLTHIIAQAGQALNPRGYLMLEHGFTQHTQVTALFQQAGFEHIETFLDLSGNPRITCGQWQSATDTSINNETQTLNIPRKLIQQLLHAAQAQPALEACGLISLREAVYRCYPITNVAVKPQTQFLLDTKQQIAALTQMRTQGETLFGIYHSHPSSPALPSKTDVHLAAYPDALHFIVSLETPGLLSVRCFKINHNLTQEIALRINDQ